MLNSVRCQSCGAPFDINISFAKLFCCEYCGAVSKVEGTTLSVIGQSNKINLGNSKLKLGVRGKIFGKEFQVLGQVRYHHDVGIWDEWHLFLDSVAVWMQQDEGEYTIYFEESFIDQAPDFSKISAGLEIQIPGHNVFVSETGEAVIAGLSGQIPKRIAIGLGFFYVDGMAGKKAISLEYYFTKTSLSVGQVLPTTDLVIY